MKTNFRNPLILGGLGVLLFAASGLAPARADRFGDLQRSIRHDMDNIRRDQGRIHDLSRKRDRQQFHGDFRGVRGTNDQLDRARLDLQHDRELLRQDRHDLDRLSFRR